MVHDELAPLNGMALELNDAGDKVEAHGVLGLECDKACDKALELECDKA
jgi:hypothetical protein